jgi:antitoxin MazE
MLRRFRPPAQMPPLIPGTSVSLFNVDTSEGENMRARIQKWGNSLALRVPKGVAELVGLAEGGEVELAVEDGSVVVKPVRQRRYSLHELVAGITDENRHDEVETGPGVGNEAW